MIAISSNLIRGIVRNRDRGNQLGLTLIELMIAMLLGLIVVGGATSIFLTVTQTYRQTGEVNRLHESVRFVTDVLTRDVRGLTSDATITDGGGAASDQFDMNVAAFSGCRVFSVTNLGLACDGTLLISGVTNLQVVAVGTPVLGYEFTITFRGVGGENVPITFRTAMRNKVLVEVQK